MSTYYCRLCFVNCKPEETLLFSKRITEMIQFCIPEVNIKLVNNPVLCPECFNKLEQMCEFKKKCVEVQDHLEKIISNNGICETADMTEFIFKEEIPSTPAPQERATQQISEYYSDQVGSDISSNALVPLSEKTCNELSILLEKYPNPIFDDNITISSSVINPTRTSKRKSSKKSKKFKIIAEVKFNKNSCETCNLSFNSLNDLLHHLYSEHQNDGELYSCLICRYKTRNKSFIIRHYRNCHPDCKDLSASCLFCSTDLNTHQELKTHMYKNHNNVCKKSRYLCNSCDFASRSFINFRKHFFQSHDLVCNYCSTHFGSVKNLNRHLKKHLPN